MIIPTISCVDISMNDFMTSVFLMWNLFKGIVLELIVLSHYKETWFSNVSRNQKEIWEHVEGIANILNNYNVYILHIVFVLCYPFYWIYFSKIPKIALKEYI